MHNPFLNSSDIVADHLSPANSSIESVEGNSAKLQCSYDTNSENIDLHWYRQYPNEAPQFLLCKGARSYSGAHIPDPRFGTTTSRSSTELHIKTLALTDTALYYCALRDLAQ